MGGRAGRVASAPAGAALKIDITQGNVEPLPIAVLDFVSEDGVGMKLAQVVTADLERSGLFRPIERAAFIETQVDVNVARAFAIGGWSMRLRWSPAAPFARMTGV